MADVHDLTGKLLEKGADNISVAEQINRLMVAAEYGKRPLPKVGTLVTVTQDLLYCGDLIKAQTPLLIMNILPSESLSACDFANVRVGYVFKQPEMGTFIRCIWLEHWCLEPYVREAEK